MWLFTTIGFFSVTRDTSTPNSKRLQVRARVKGDLDLLRSSFLPELTPTIQLPARDYPYRGYCSKEQMGAAMLEISMAIDYTNFKSEVTRKQGLAREQLYHQVWSVMNNAEDKIGKNAKENARWDAKEKAGWFKHQTKLKFEPATNRPKGPVTRIGGDDFRDTRDQLNANDFKDPFDDNDDPNDNIDGFDGVDINRMTDKEFDQYCKDQQIRFYAGQVVDTRVDEEPAMQNDLDFLDQVAREMTEMQDEQTAARAAKGVQVRKGKGTKGTK